MRLHTKMSTDSACSLVNQVSVERQIRVTLEPDHQNQRSRLPRWQPFVEQSRHLCPVLPSWRHEINVATVHDSICQSTSNDPLLPEWTSVSYAVGWTSSLTPSPWLSHQPHWRLCRADLSTRKSNKNADYSTMTQRSRKTTNIRLESRSICRLYAISACCLYSWCLCELCGWIWNHRRA